VLKEHFRCVPEIIQFSNDLMYGGKMDPLRLPMAHEMLAPAIQTIRVPEGFRDENTRQTLNQPEAEAIVSHIVKCCGNPQYENRTIGVISLQGHDQAKLIESLLRDAIGEEEMINRKLICGDAYSFQGDERDVIILSMVAANNVRIGPLVKTSDMQRFNVAASRARDQMILFHSVDLKDLNPNCMRYRLLQYCIDPHRVQEEMEEVNGLFDSEFERDVYRLIAARGYRIIPQVKVGSVGKRIDLVVEGMRNRLAVECDGDRWHGLDKWEDDMERQGILERVGWTFWRVRGSTFYRDPERSMEPLWERLKEMDIQPQIIEKESAVEQQQPEEQHFQFEDLKEESIVTKETEDALQTNTAQELTSAVIKDSTDKALVQKKDDVKSIPRENNITEDRVLQLTLDDYVTNEKEIRENFNLEAHLSKLGLEVIDKRPPGGVLWVIGGIELSHIMKDLAERGYLFTLSASGGKATNKRVAWYMK
jgi:very-short-patch-repair endonuclease